MSSTKLTFSMRSQFELMHFYCTDHNRAYTQSRTKTLWTTGHAFPIFNNSTMGISLRKEKAASFFSNKELYKQSKNYAILEIKEKYMEEASSLLLLVKSDF
uniref:Uncharacterized protein n=1 Tax=Romanomermis culicivorax TaxID=13658 RepID=A0A915KYB5_ROMCU